MTTAISPSNSAVLFNSLAQNLPMGVAWCHSSGELLGINSFLEKELGVEASEVENWHLWELFVEKDRLEADFKPILAGRRPRVQDLAKLRNARQEPLWCKLTLTYHHEIDADPFAMLLVQKVEDIRLNAQENLAQKDILKVMDKQLDEGVFRVSDHQGLMYANQRFLELFGYSAFDEVKYLEFEAFLDSSITHEDILLQLRSAGRVDRYRTLFRRKDGSKFVGRLNLNMTTDARGIDYCNGSILDITEFEESQTQLEGKTRQLEELNAQLDRFLYSACHDLRSPISSMQGLLHLMQLDNKGDQAEYMDRLSQSLDNLNSITHDMITFAKNSHQKVDSSRIHFERLVNDTILKFQGFPGFDTIDFQMHVNEELPFFTDEPRLVSILTNLIKNAILFHDPQKPRPFVKVEVEVRPDRVLIDIIDNGDGIAKNYLDKIFGMFFRASDRSAGPGLGLYIVKETLEKLNGTIRVESELGHGSIFSVEIPNGTKGKLMSKKMKLYGSQ